MNCPKCSTVNEAEAAFCANCGTRLSVQQFSSAQPKPNPVSNQKVEEVKDFFKNDLGRIIKAIFSEPIQGTRDIFTNAGNNAYNHALILLGTTIITFIIIPYFWVGSEVRQYLPGAFGMFVKLGLSVGLMLVIISVLSFGVKSISGKPDFKKELLTGAMCGLPMIIMLLAIIVISVFSGNRMSNFNPSSLMQNGIIAMLVSLYILLMLINIVQQSFKASGTNDAMSWYISPLVICVGIYIGVRISYKIFGAGF
ncbi:MAG: zinc ribbon domain-containing protein [Bacteroidia bacterium]|nr:zinc ribbon domain-containing protein [Bacteroidia bacterium]